MNDEFFFLIIGVTNARAASVRRGYIVNKAKKYFKIYGLDRGAHPKHSLTVRGTDEG